MKKFYTLLFCTAALLCGSCSDDKEEPSSRNGIPTDRFAEPNPEIPGESNVSIPNMSAPIIEEGTNNEVMRFSLTGIKTANNDWLKLYGTNDAQQNIWMSIDATPKAFVVINGEDIAPRAASVSKAQADVVFLVDNSGSMSEEADAVAAEILSWTARLSSTMDVQFGCVGYGDRGDSGIDGALNITDVNTLYDYLNRDYFYGTERTIGYSGPDAEVLRGASYSYQNGSYNECGALALHFADENFAFREGANRLYVNLTDEPNQPNGDERWSVETVNRDSPYYNWNTAKGTIHSVYSGSERDDYGWWQDLYDEKP